jgi:hypothetical protein
MTFDTQEAIMTTDPTTSRPWQDVAKELSGEKRTNRVAELGDELVHALDEQTGKPNNLATEDNA